MSLDKCEIICYTGIKGEKRMCRIGKPAYALFVYPEKGRSVMEIVITVSEKIARVRGNPVIVCGNSGYTLRVRTDSEWDALPDIRVLLTWMCGGRAVCVTVPLNDGRCELPAVHGACEVYISLYAGNVHTSVPAVIPCEPCVTDLPGSVMQPPADFYHILTEAMNRA